MKMVKLHWKQKKKLNEALSNGLLDFAYDLDRIIKAKEVVPKDSGDLENSQTIVPIRGLGDAWNEVEIKYTVDYAKKLYYNEQGLNISKEKNKNATSRWLEEVLFDKKNVYMLAQRVRTHLADFNYDYKWSEDDMPFEDVANPAKELKPKNTPKPAEKPKITTPHEKMAQEAERFGGGLLDVGARRGPGSVKPSGAPRPPGGPMVRPAGPKPKP